MNKVLSWVMAAALTSGLNVAMASCSSNDDNSATTKRGQLLEVYDVQGSEGKARLTVDGKVLFVTDVYVGKNGLGKTGEGDGKTPVGILHPLSAFGIKPNPGTKMPYIDVKPTTFACDEELSIPLWYTTRVRARRCTPTSRSTTMASPPTSTRSASIPMVAPSSSM